MSSADVLTHRVGMLERSYLGNSSCQFNMEASIEQKIRKISIALESIEEEIPAIKNCYELVNKIRPLLSERKFNAVELNKKIEVIAANKEFLQEHIKQLTTIHDLSHVISAENYKGLMSVRLWVCVVVCLFVCLFVCLID
jgi:CRISPR/Cas system-associated endonuclease Cas3-HD